ncbi:MAG TPA: hypothetical protein VE684_07145 [Crenalkalicoccus sp.]|jgi:hypothetical protein|nr:hypothetical protein [Crenalkalicoccus sp.]
MPRLIDVSSQQPLPPAVTLRAGDLLLVRATGGAVVSGKAAVEALGVFGAASLAPDGGVLTAAGGPDAVLFLARARGRARIEVVRGDPWQGPRRATTIEVTVEPS